MYYCVTHCATPAFNKASLVTTALLRAAGNVGFSIWCQGWKDPEKTLLVEKGFHWKAPSSLKPHPWAERSLWLAGVTLEIWRALPVSHSWLLATVCCGIFEIQTSNLWITGWTAFCWATWKPSNMVSWWKRWKVLSYAIIVKRTLKIKKTLKCLATVPGASLEKKPKKNDFLSQPCKRGKPIWNHRTVLLCSQKIFEIFVLI